MKKKSLDKETSADILKLMKLNTWQMIYLILLVPRDDFTGMIEVVNILI